MFTGELNVLSGRRGFPENSGPPQPAKLIEIEARGPCAAWFKTDSELSDIFLRAFILRRLELIARGDWRADSDWFESFARHLFALKSFLLANYQPYSYVDLDTDADVQYLLDRFHIAIDDLPVLICRRTTVLRKSEQTRRSLIALASTKVSIKPTWRDMIVVGAGPRWFGGGKYTARPKALDVLLIESDSPGGQARSSSKI